MASHPAMSQAEINLVRAGEKMEAAIRALVEIPGARGSQPLQECLRLLTEAANLIEIAQHITQQLTQQGGVSEGLRQALLAGGPLRNQLIALTRQLRSSAQRATLLLDSAAVFYRGWLAAAPPAPPTYAPDGTWASVSTPGILRHEA